MLTHKMEKFAENLAAGMSQREAYKHSYDAGNMSDRTIDNKAYALFKRGDVRARYDELRGEIEKVQETRAIMTALERREWLTKVINGEVPEEGTAFNQGQVMKFNKQPSLNDKMKAMDILNKMDGEYKTVVDGTVEIKNKLEDLL